MGAAVWGEVANAALQVGSSWMNSDSQRLANRTNVKLQREQQAWEAMMSNTAIQRRVADIKAAGGNPATAFTNGGEASTPTVTAAHVDAPQFAPIRTNFTAAMLADAQKKNIDADTMTKLADARAKKVDADIAEATASQKRQWTVNNYLEGYDQQDLKTQLQRKLVESASVSADVARRTADALVKNAVAQAKTGTLKADALENIAKIGGIEAGEMAPVIKLILSFLTTASGKD